MHNFLRKYLISLTENKQISLFFADNCRNKIFPRIHLNAENSFTQMRFVVRLKIGKIRDVLPCVNMLLLLFFLKGKIRDFSIVRPDFSHKSASNSSYKFVFPKSYLLSSAVRN